MKRMREDKLTVLPAHVTERFVHVMFRKVECIPDDREPWRARRERLGAGNASLCPLEHNDEDSGEDDVEESGVESGHGELDKLYSS